MNGKKAKQLRKMAKAVTDKETEHALVGKQVLLQRGCFRHFYKYLKHADN